MNNTKRKVLIFSIVAVAAIVVTFALYQTGIIGAWYAGKARANAEASQKRDAPKLLELADGSYGVELSADAIKSLELKPQEAVRATSALPLPPMIGTVNYDNDLVFQIKPRFTGKIVGFKMVKTVNEVLKNGSPDYKQSERPIKFGDKVKLGEVMAVFMSRDIGEKKASLVDAVINLRLSDMQLERHEKIYKDGAISEATLNQTQRQHRLDSNAVMLAERTLRMWELGDKEINEIKAEANVIHDQKRKRNIVEEVQRWARVEVMAPEFGPKIGRRDLTILEKNTSVGDMVDPANYGVPLFRVADLSRLQIWVHPQEEDLDTLRNQLNSPSGLRWKIRFQSDPKKTYDLPVDLISPSLEPNQHTPMLIGYLDNPDYKYLVGQFVTATIMVPPPEDTVEIPTDAVNPLNGQEFVFIENPTAKNQFLIRRVSVVRSLKNTSFVRSKLMPDQKQVNEGEYPLEELKAGDRVVTRGVVELTAALEEIRNAKK